MTSMTIQARAPGKIILMGEHAVLHGCPAIATALGLYCTIKVQPRGDGQIELQLPDLNLHRCYTFQTLLDYVGRVRQSSAQGFAYEVATDCLLYTSDAADE